VTQGTAHKAWAERQREGSTKVTWDSSTAVKSSIYRDRPKDRLDGKAAFSITAGILTGASSGPHRGASSKFDTDVLKTNPSMRSLAIIQQSIQQPQARCKELS